jgi:hypothetical protein
MKKILLCLMSFALISTAQASIHLSQISCRLTSQETREMRIEMSNRQAKRAFNEFLADQTRGRFDSYSKTLRDAVNALESAINCSVVTNTLDDHLTDYQLAFYELDELASQITSVRGIPISTVNRYIDALTKLAGLSHDLDTTTSLISISRIRR